MKYDLLWFMRKSSHNLSDFPLLVSQRKAIKSAWFTEFPHSGLYVFCGSQGNGKTTSAVQLVFDLIQLYPNVRLVTNIDLCFMGIPNEVIKYTDTDDLGKYGNNGLDGVIFLLDEIHLQWNSLESKSVTPADMIEFAQSRKQRRLIIGTSQRMNRLAKPLREQLKYIVDCHCLFGMLQRNTVVDMETAREMPDGTLHFEKGFSYWFFHSFELRTVAFDTYQKMQRGGSNRWRKS